MWDLVWLFRSISLMLICLIDICIGGKCADFNMCKRLYAFMRVNARDYIYIAYHARLHILYIAYHARQQKISMQFLVPASFVARKF